MVQLSPFAALRPAGEVVERTLDGALPGAARAARRRLHPRQAAWLEAFDDGDVPTVDSWVADGSLLEDDRPLLRVVEQRLVDGTAVVGVLGAVRLADLVPHERTDPGAVARRLARDRHQTVETRPLLAVLPRDPDGLVELVARITSGSPETDVVDELGIRHRVWVCGDEHAIRATLVDSPCLLADGHHRAEAAARDGREQAMALVALASQHPRLLPVWRIAAVPGGHRADVDAWVDELPPGGAVEVHALGRRRWVAGHPGELSVEASQRIAEQVPGVSRVTTTADPAAAAVAERDGAVVVAAAPPTVAEVLASIVAGRPLPPKSTAFTPKPRAGLLIRRLTSP